jgi:hypothetical protein
VVRPRITSFLTPLPFNLAAAGLLGPRAAEKDEFSQGPGTFASLRQQMKTGCGTLPIAEDGVRVFTASGNETLIEVVQMYKENPAWLKRWQSE